MILCGIKAEDIVKIKKICDKQDQSLSSTDHAADMPLISVTELSGDAISIK